MLFVSYRNPGNFLSGFFYLGHRPCEIKKIEQKTCLIQGEDDQYGSSMQIIKASELIKAESEFHFIKNCKHSPHLEKKEELIKIIKNFIYSMV